MKKLTEHTYGGSIFMRLELDGKVEEITCYSGRAGSWNTYRTSADDNAARRNKIIAAFKQLY